MPKRKLDKHSAIQDILENLTPTRNPSFLKFPLLPTEIRLMIWKLARPDSRIIKLSRSKELSKPAVFFNYVCSFQHDHLVSKIPVPNLLHTCFESRSVARNWYTLLFILSCGCGGTYIDTERDYMYYGTEEQQLLINPQIPTPGFRDRDSGNMWVKDRQSIPNIVVHLSEPLESMSLVCRLLATSKWCNELAEEVLLLGYRVTDLKVGTMISDLGKDVSSFETGIPETMKKVEAIGKYLEVIRKLEPFWGKFKPKRMVSVGLFGTHNVEQTYGFNEDWTLDRRVYLGFGPANAFEQDEDDGEHIPLD
ncbi:hypothetical protein N431DRAFT_564036 [Stipitochalara longipes BDJ]|nr:hypothetical protein N431DRAFT_564036 [Stipitochalara longipes BDJ]